MSLNILLPVLTGVLFIFTAIYLGVTSFRHARNIWLFPAALSVMFLVFSLYTVISEGPLGFWQEHTRNFWGNQIWFDLLLAVGIGWTLAVPQAKALGMRPLVWLVPILMTGSIGFLAMLARMLYLRERHLQHAGHM